MLFSVNSCKTGLSPGTVCKNWNWKRSRHWKRTFSESICIYPLHGMFLIYDTDLVHSIIGIKR